MDIDLSISDLADARAALRGLREKTGQSQAELAAACQISRQRYSTLESAGGNMSLRTFLRALAACGYRIRLEQASRRPNLMQLGRRSEINV